MRRGSIGGRSLGGPPMEPLRISAGGDVKYNKCKRLAVLQRGEFILDTRRCEMLVTNLFAALGLRDTEDCHVTIYRDRPIHVVCRKFHRNLTFTTLLYTLENFENFESNVLGRIKVVLTWLLHDQRCRRCCGDCLSANTTFPDLRIAQKH